MNESKIIRHAKGGDSIAFNTLVKHYQLRLLKFAYFHTGNRADAEDIVQETFWNVFLHIKKQKDDGKFFNWLYTIEMNIIKRYYHKRKKRSTVNLEPWDENFVFLDEGILSPEDKLCLKNAIESLNDIERSIIYLKYFENYSIKEIAELFDTREDSVKSRLYRIKKKLEIFLSGDNSNEEQ